MKFATRPTLILIAFLTAVSNVDAQEVTRDLAIVAGGTLEIVNRNGRIAVKAEPDTTKVPASVKAFSPAGLADEDLKIVASGGRTTITVAPKDKQKRIDIVLTVPERISIKAETLAGAIEAAGNFASVEARSDTGTIMADVPADDVKYQFQWTESRPRYLADFDIAEVKEKSAGRFEIKGRRLSEDGEKVKRGEGEEEPKTEDQKPKTVSLNLTTARGIILLNVPPSEVMSDLRERPLTNAAKAIVRSGDSLLMEAIRRASPKYFGDYARSLPPLRFEPGFATTSGRLENPNARTKTALVRVTDEKNRAIAGLAPADFEVTENGQSREIISVERSEAPFNLVLLLDVSGSVENYVNFIRKTARNFVDTVHANDRVSIVIFNEDVKKLSDFTTDKKKLVESLDTFDAGGGTAYYDALAYAISDTLRPLKGERTAIVVLTDGDDNRSFLAFDSLAGSIQESGALVYPLYVPSGLIALGAQGQTADIDPMRKKYMSLTAKSGGEGERLAKISGGVYYPITQIGQIQRAYEDIVLQMRSAYNITYRSDFTAGGVSPKLKIRAKRENVFTAITSVTARSRE
ncbi:MAG TPA: VWA domain-containing protein [Pyrinomonadaceae bacterium]|nr:VWA domain-containing protein [Pyrinomonadaceae bacterium]